jgi:hypothetical protein
MPLSSPSSSPIPRTPGFLSLVKGSVGQAMFGAPSTAGGPARIVPFFERPDGDQPSATAAEVPAMEPSPEIEPLAPPLPPPQPRPGPEFMERLARAVSDLRQAGERLAEQASSDAFEMALIIARRVLEAELSAGTAPLFSLVRSAVRRLGESRKITIRLCPADAAALEAAGTASALGGLAVARIEIRADAKLSSGDCVVDGEYGAVDGRLGTRLDEVRRILVQALTDVGEVAP